MPKILYIPTGEYLKYYGDNGSSTFTTLSKEDVEMEIRELLSWEDSDSYENVFNSWIDMNNVILPILLSELEIINDD